MSQSASILTINGGSSSIKFAIHEADADAKRLLTGKLDRLGLSDTTLTIDSTGQAKKSEAFEADGSASSLDRLLDLIGQEPIFSSVVAVGHRIVHGMAHTDPEPVTKALLKELRDITPYDPEHLPLEIALVESFGRRFPKIPQVACFDTAFHQTMPRVAKILPIPRSFDAKGVQRYGFHGISYSFLLEELLRLGDPAATKGKVILAHLGNGASLAAVFDGKSIDTSMAFTPAAGLVMSTRSGDLDPGLIGYFAKTERMTIHQFEKMVNHKSGLLGVSELSPDMRDLLDKEKKDIRAAEAVELFCYQTKKWIGAYAAALGGLDTLVFAGGIGENSPLARERICDGLEFLGICLDHSRNLATAPVISKRDSSTTVRVIHTDEELMIARSVFRVLNLGARKEL